MGNSNILSRDQNNSYKGTSTICAIRVSDIDDSLEWFGNYTDDGKTPIILIPDRSSCMPYIYVPEGAHAVVTSHGEFSHV
jgi:hypothetical protein